MRPDTFTPERAQRLLKFLAEEGPCPFYKIAAERAGVNYKTAFGWFARAERDQDLGVEDSDLVKFATEVRRIQGDWKAKTMAKITSADKDTRDAAANERWLLERLDRETFDMSRQPKNAPKGQTDKPQPLSAVDLEKTLSDLEKPETMVQ